jgi:hypothetical protein
MNGTGKMLGEAIGLGDDVPSSGLQSRLEERLRWM